jgi:hypothetical protein
MVVVVVVMALTESSGRYSGGENERGRFGPQPI